MTRAPKKSSGKKQTLIAKRAEPIRQLLRELLHSKIKSHAEREKLANYLDKSVSYVNAMIYHGEGGLDAWLSALAYVFDLNAAQICKFFEEAHEGQRKKKPVTESDKLWFSLDRHLDENEKYYWANVVMTAVDLEKQLKKKKK